MQGLVQQALRRRPRAAAAPPAGGDAGGVPAGEVRQDVLRHQGALRGGGRDMRRVHLKEEKEGLHHQVRHTKEPFLSLGAAEKGM